MDREFYINIIHKQFSGETTVDEDKLLTTYLNASMDNQQWADEIRLSWELGEAVHDIPEVDVEAELKKAHVRMDQGNNTQVKDAKEIELRPNKSINKERTLIPKYIAIAASILAVLAVGFKLFNSGGINGIDNIETIVAINGTKTIDLPDGSSIWLREGGTIKYAKDQVRQITLLGQAFFDVERDETNPFTISVDETLVAVLGTSFSVNGGDDGTIEVQVATGRVSMSNEYDEVVLVKGAAAVYNPADQKMHQVVFDDPLQEAWKSGRFIFKEASLANIISELEAYYNVQIELSNNDLRNCKKTTSVQVKSINEVIQSIATQFQLSVRKIADTSYVLDGDQCL